MTPGSSAEFSRTASAASIVEKGADGDDDDGSGDDDQHGHKKQEWSSPLEFLLSCIAMSVGLGSKPRPLFSHNSSCLKTLAAYNSEPLFQE